MSAPTWAALRTGIDHALRFLLAAALVLPSTSPVYADGTLPQGARVVSGSVGIAAPQGASLTVNQQSQRAIVNWSAFSVGSSASVEFRQPDRSAAILNRVTGATPSSIAGQISGNGQVYLVNPNGIAITPSGNVRIDGGFVASTLGIEDDDFNAGRLRFKGRGTSAAVSNSGSLAGGVGSFVGLIGGSVENDGTVSVPVGRIGFGAGEQVTLDLNGDGFLQVAVPSGRLAGQGKSQIDVKGRIAAPGGTIELKAANVRNAIRDAVNVPGHLSAKGASGRNGSVVIGGGEGGRVKVSGTVKAGREIAVEAAQITISGTLDASRSPAEAGPAGDVRMRAVDGIRIDNSARIEVSGLEAGAVDIDGGALVEVSGKTVADGVLRGGRIDVTAGEVFIAQAVLQARGTELGGIVRVGGAFRGGRPVSADAEEYRPFIGRFGDLPTLASGRTTRIDDGTIIDVSSSSHTGAAGTLVVWSEMRTDVGASILARDDTGGAAIELSSRGVLGPLSFSRIEIGAGGRLLLDPKDIQVVTVGPFDPAGSYAYDGAATTTVLDAREISDLLVRFGVNVTLEASNDISIGAQLGFSSTGEFSPKFGDLTLKAGRSIHSEALLLNSATDRGNRISILANDPDAIGERDPGEAEIFLKRIEAGTDGDIDITMGTGKGEPIGAISLFGEINARSLTVVHPGDPSGLAFRPYISIFKDITTRLDQSYSGDLDVVPFNIGSHVDLKSNEGHVVWLTEATSRIATTLELPATVSFWEGGIQTRHGFLERVFGDIADADATRLALGPEAGTTVTSVYGTGVVSSKTGPLWHIVRGALRDTDTAADVAPDVFQVFGIDSSMHVLNGGTADVILPPGTTFAFKTTTPGYFIDLTSGRTPVTITPRNLTPIVSSNGYTYGSPGVLVTFSGLLAQDFGQFGAEIDAPTAGGTLPLRDRDGSGGLQLDPRVRAGTHDFTLLNVTPQGAFAAADYIVNAPAVTTGTVTVFPKQLTVACCDQSAVYGSTLGVTMSFDGVLPGDEVTAARIFLQNATLPVPIEVAERTSVGTYTMMPGGLSGAQAGNYEFDTLGSPTLPTLTVTPRVLNPIPVTQQSYTYGDAPPTRQLGGGGELSGDDVFGALYQRSSGLPFTERTAAGIYDGEFKLEGAAAGNYVLAVPVLPTVTVGKRRLSGTMIDATVTYGDAHGVLPGANLQGVLPGDDVAGVAGVLEFDDATSLPSFANAGTYHSRLLGLTGAQAGNYDPASVLDLGLITVEPRLLTYAIDSAIFTYGETRIADQAFVTLTNLAPHDVGNLQPVVSVTDGSGLTRTLGVKTPAGSYTSSVTGLAFANIGVAYSAPNYVFAPGGPTAVLTIDKRILSYTLADSTGTYGSPLAVGQIQTFNIVNAGRADIEGLAPGEFARVNVEARDANGALASVVVGRDSVLPAGTPAGSYSVAGTTVVDAGVTGFDANNYRIVTSGPATATLAPKAINYNVAPSTVTYGDPFAPPVTFLGLLAADAGKVEPVLSYTAPGFSAIDPTGRLDAFPVRGDYTVRTVGLRGDAAGNYVIAGTGNIDQTLRINPRQLAWSIGDATSVYGHVPVLGTATINGVLAGDTVLPGAVSGAGARLDGRDNVGSYPLRISLSGPSALNYVLGAPDRDATLAVTPRPVTVKAKDFQRFYHQGFGPRDFEVVGGSVAAFDTLDVLLATPATTGSDVGSYPIVPSLVGADATNYAFAGIPGTLVIAPTVLSASLNTFDVQYGGAPNGGTVHDDILRLRPTYRAVADGALFLEATTERIVVERNGVEVGFNTRSPVGIYSARPAIAASNNYVLDVTRSRTGFRVTPRPVLLPAGSTTAAYGDRWADIGDLENVLPGDVVVAAVTDLAGVVTRSNIWNDDGTLKVPQFAPRVGTYDVAHAQLNGSDASNYKLEFAGQTYTITPRPITVTAISNIQTTYGDAVVTSLTDPATRRQATYFNTGTTFQFDNLVMPTHAASLVPQASTQYAFTEETTDDTTGETTRVTKTSAVVARANAGDYTLAVVPGTRLAVSGVEGPSLCGPANSCIANNYVLTNAPQAAADVTIAPRELAFTVTGGTATYGDPLTVSGQLQGVLPGDEAGLNIVFGVREATSVFIPDKPFVALLGSTYSAPDDTHSGTIARAPAGSYDLTVAGLAGKQAGNYVAVDPLRGLNDGSIEIEKRAVTYKTGTGSTFAQFGLIPETARAAGDIQLSGLVAGDQVSGALALKIGENDDGTPKVFPFSDLIGVLNPIGTFPIIVSRLGGPHGANYTIDHAGSEQGTLTIFQLFNSDLDFFDLVDTDIISLPKPLPPLPPPTPLPSIPEPPPPSSNDGGNGGSPGQAEGSAGVGAEAGASGQLGDAHAEATAEVKAEVSAQINMWSTTPIDLSASVSATISGSVHIEGTCGGSACSLDISAYVEAGASLSAKLDLLSGAFIGAEAHLTTGLDSVFTADCGAATCVLSGGVHASLTAEASASAKFDKGIVVDFGATASAGVEASGEFSVSGEFGQAGGHGGVTSGKVGVGFGGGASFDDGVLSFQLGFAFNAGFGGIELGLDFDLDIGKIAEEIEAGFVGRTVVWYETGNRTLEETIERIKLSQALSKEFRDLQEQQIDFYRWMLRKGITEETRGDWMKQVERLREKEAAFIEKSRAAGYRFSQDNTGIAQMTDTDPPVLIRHEDKTQGLVDTIGGLF